VHYLLIGDIELCLDDKEVSALLLKKWLTLEKRTGVMHKFTRIRTRKDLNKTVDYLTDYASSKDNAVKKNASLQGMPYDFNPISCSRELEKPSELICDFNPYENEEPTFRTSTSKPFYEEYIEYE
jgi:predicted DNA binding CopG/RHH family protein